MELVVLLLMLPLLLLLSVVEVSMVLLLVLACLLVLLLQRLTDLYIEVQQHNYTILQLALTRNDQMPTSWIMQMPKVANEWNTTKAHC